MTMHPHRADRWLVPTLGLLVLALAAGCGVEQSASPPAPTGTPPPSLLATPGYLSCLGLHFVPVATTDPQAAPVISSEQAVSAVWQYQPSLKSATILDVSLGRLGNAPGSGTTTSVLAGTPLVWVVSFSGVVSVSSGPPGAVHHTSNEYSVVIDATSAKALVAFPLCNDTLPPTQAP
jgi:hypothetical protein